MDIIGLKEAAAIENVSTAVVWKWCKKHQIGRQEGRSWIIDRERLRVIAEASRTLGLVQK